MRRCRRTTLRSPSRRVPSGSTSRRPPRPSSSQERTTMEAKRKARLWLMALMVLVTAVLELRVLVGQAHAIIGRPLTPLSFAGVARRTTRRAVYGGAAYGAAAYGAAGLQSDPGLPPPGLRGGV